jgi:hypothetical protein
MNYYRLIQEDVDGNKTNLGIRAVNVNGGKQIIQVYPNPAHAELNINLGTYENGQKQVEMYNILGKRMFSKLLNVRNGLIKLTLNEAYGAGVYLIKIGKSDQVSVVIQ